MGGHTKVLPVLKHEPNTAYGGERPSVGVKAFRNSNGGVGRITSVSVRYGIPDLLTFVRYPVPDLRINGGTV